MEIEKKKELLFSVTKNDLEWEYFRGSGKGGHKKNKTSSAVRCNHKLSGAVGRAEDSRSQSGNRKLAFRRMAESKEFQKWVQIESARVLGWLDEIEKKVDREIKTNVLTEVKDDQGRLEKISEIYLKTEND